MVEKLQFLVTNQNIKYNILYYSIKTSNFFLIQMVFSAECHISSPTNMTTVILTNAWLVEQLQDYDRKTLKNILYLAF